MVALDKSVFHFGDVVTQVLRDMKSDVETKKMNVSLADSSAHFLVQGDRSRVVQILANLLSNAVKYSPSESSIEIDVDHYKEASESLRINVRNHESGIPSEDRDKVFQKFYRIDNSSTGQRRGPVLAWP